MFFKYFREIYVRKVLLFKVKMGEFYYKISFEIKSFIRTLKFCVAH